MPDRCQGLSFSICNMGEQTRPSGLSPISFSLYILTLKSDSQRQAQESAFPRGPGCPLGRPFLEGQLPETGDAGPVSG